MQQRQYVRIPDSRALVSLMISGWTIDEPRDIGKFTKIVSFVVFSTNPTVARKK